MAGRFLFFVCFANLACLLLAPLSSAAAESDKLEPFLNALLREETASGAKAALAVAKARGIKTRSGPGGLTVGVIVEPRKGLAPKAIDRGKLGALGGDVDAASGSRLRVLVALKDLEQLATHPDIASIRAPIPAKELEAGFGSRVSESVALTGADVLQSSGVSGAGVKVSVVDLGFQGLADAIAQGELPADTVGVDFTGTGLEADTPHGVGVAEHVMDMAPG
jgi:hypothetical protein